MYRASWVPAVDVQIASLMVLRLIARLFVARRQCSARITTADLGGIPTAQNGTARAALSNTFMLSLTASPGI